MVSIRALASVFLLGAGVAVGLSLLLSWSPGRGDPRGCCLSPEQERILAHMRFLLVDDGNGGYVPTVRFTGVDVQVVNGLGATNGYPRDPASIQPSSTRTNGAGNLIVGYNELGNFAGDERSGSHNLVVGAQNSYGSFGGRVFGQQNRALGPFAAVSGGQFNWADGPHAIVSGGDSNEAHGTFAVALGGEHNVAAGFATTVGGGFGNQATGDFSAITGGVNNAATGSSAHVCGGSFNLAQGPVTSIAGGFSNAARGQYSTLGGGEGRTVEGRYDWRAGDLFQED